MKGIAISLATASDAEFIDRIEKLTGFKIARVGSGDGGSDAKSDERPRPSSKAPEKTRKREEPRKQEQPRQREEPRQRAEPRKREERREPPPIEQNERPAREKSPVVEDIADEWNGPMPSFLTKSAG
jgi:superfamily II DNA/RNA helicase